MIHYQHIFLKQFIAVIIVLSISSTALNSQINSASTIKDVYELETGEEYKLDSNNETVKRVVTCANNLIYSQNTNGNNVEQGHAVTGPTFGTGYDDFSFSSNVTIDQVTTYLLYFFGSFDPSLNFVVNIIGDNGGIPDVANIICSNQIAGTSISPTTVGFAFNRDVVEATMTLPNPCILSAGTYWLCITSTSNSNFAFWEVINSGGPVIGNPNFVDYPFQGGLLPGASQTGDISDHAFALCGTICDPRNPVIISNGSTNKKGF